MHDSKLEEVQEQEVKKFNVDAIQILEDIKRECESHSRCRFCPFIVEFIGDEICPFKIIPAEWELNNE